MKGRSREPLPKRFCMLYNLYIYDRYGTCLYYKDYHRSKMPESLEEEQKLLYGMLYSFNVFVSKTSPKPEDESGGFRYFRTTAYKLHHFATASGYRIVLNSDANTPDLREELKHIYGIFVEYAMKNPLYKPHTEITHDSFVLNLQSFIKALPSFAS